MAVNKLSRVQRDILELIHDGKSPSSIAKALRLVPSTISYHIGRLAEAGLVGLNPHETKIERMRLGIPNLKVYGLTEQGLAALQTSMNRTPTSQGGEERVRSERGPRVEVHNFEVKIPVKAMGISWLPDAAKLNNWTRQYDPDFHGVYLEVTTKHILLRAGAEGATREIAEALALRKVVRVQQLLETQYGCDLGPPQMRLVYAPGRTKVGAIGLGFTKGLPAQKGELADIDATPEDGTVHPHDPNDADAIVNIARNSADTRELAQALALSVMSLNDAVKHLADVEGEILKGLSGRPSGPPPPPDERRDVA
jgi:DNA-binding transcriptional ArsR family regulator